MNQHTEEDGGYALSFEFFPATTPEAQARFWRTVGCLETLSPAFFSMTCGAMGSTRDNSFDMLGQLALASDVPVAAHLTCGNRSTEAVRTDLAHLRAHGVDRLVALRGDLPETATADAQDNVSVCRYASDLVELACAERWTDISVAAYPEVHPDAMNATADLQALKYKLDAGGTRAITQFFYDPDVLLRFRDQMQSVGITQPLVPGVLPIHDIEKVITFSQRCGAEIPINLVDEFRVWADDSAASHELAVAQSLSLCETLKREGFDHFHFYTLNRSDLSYEVANLLVGEQATGLAAA